MASSSSSSSPSAPALSSRSWKYHVFLSFRGEDTRNTFVSHLYSALEQQGIHTYKDDETLPRGESIRPSLMKAIEESRIAVIVFSKNYGNSSWCLDELAHIMKCRDTRGQIVMPIFFDVGPSEVRKQKRTYREAFAKYELQNKTKVESWKKALVDASNISGWEPKHIANGHEAKGIKQIVFEISQKLQPITSRLNDQNLVGMAARMQGLKSELEIGSGGVRMVGIWGVGGGGKTTLAYSIYNEISTKFDSCCFVENIREESGRYGLGKLKEKILSEMGVNRAGGARSFINYRFLHRKVLIVLDDVDHLGQLKALAGSCDWFGEGSRIIITTRDEHVLTGHKVDVIHNIILLNSDEAMKLFCKHAPLDNRPVEDYVQLSKEVVSYAGGLPLALTVLGSFLCDKNIHEWKSALARLKEIPDNDILEKLKVSFDGLKPVEKDLFLDIACFFRWEYKDEAMKILDACGFHPVVGVKVLIQKALITISNGKFDMHDLVQEMGHHIVRGEHPNNPEKHSRVWKKEDVLNICAMDGMAKLDNIGAINFRHVALDKSQSYLQAVANMNKLRWVDLYVEQINETTRPLPEHFLTSHDLGENFPPRELCCLRLANLMQKQLWEGYKLLPNLKIMELYRLLNLRMTPDFAGLPNLERFNLTLCWYLEEIHPSIGCSERLIFLSISSCPGLKIFPSIIGLKKLEILKFSNCPTLFKLSEIQQNTGNLPFHLDNSGEEQVKKPGEHFIDVEECCLEQSCLPHNNINHIGLCVFNRGLRKLDLSCSILGDKNISDAVWELPNLEELDLSQNKFSQLNFDLLLLPQLKWLNVSHCTELVELSELPSSITVVIADGCKSLETLGDISNCKWLWKVSLKGNNKVGPLVGDILLHSMLQGNAIEDHFVSFTLPYQIPKRFEGRLFRGETFTMHLPQDWYKDFCGFLICFVHGMYHSCIEISIKQEPKYDGKTMEKRYEIQQESNKVSEPSYDGKTTFVGYVSFGSFRNISLMNSSYNMISFFIKNIGCSSSAARMYIGAELVPRKCKGVHVQKTDCSEFWDQETYRRKSFRIQHDSKSSIKIIWHLYENNWP